MAEEGCLHGLLGFVQSNLADELPLPPAAYPPRLAAREASSSGSGKGKAKAPLEQTEGGAPPGNGKGKQPYRRPGKGPASPKGSPGRGNGKAPAGKAPARESD